MKATSQAGNLVTKVAPASGIMQTVSHMVDMTMLRQMEDKDPKEMGIPMNYRMGTPALMFLEASTVYVTSNHAITMLVFIRHSHGYCCQPQNALTDKVLLLGFDEG
ncbi:hypothetical protein P3X46_026064 [Hevea brasiliensis]|uniref:Uncharacterized protein n=1 Tax=Hevea brasiliensis TaxID=3981 RepID=A0ABQ9KX27_HEVBR|nr:hypothetical protein P3X46_026064 [Hevea brasiliensis]